MSTLVAAPAATVRSLVEAVAVGFDSGLGRDAVSMLWAPRAAQLQTSADHELDHRRTAAQNLVGAWLAAYSLGELSGDCSVVDAQEWLRGDTPGLPGLGCRAPSRLSAGTLSSSECAALFPYLVDPLGAGTRRAVLKDRNEASVRARRKAAGVYYTPADVAHFMARQALRATLPGRPVSVLDPSVGSGVFLRSASASLACATECSAYGLDIDPAALDMTAWVLVSAQGWRGWPSPWAAWHAHRLNLAQADTLLVRPGTHLDPDRAERSALARKQIVDELRAGRRPDPAGAGRVGRGIGDIFPELSGGADIVLTNPPYTQLGPHPLVGQPRLAEGGGAYRPTNRTFPIFVERALEFLAPHGRLAAVVPLSIAFGRAADLRAIRSALLSGPGRVDFLNFDRTPDALFGDDIKTRNTIVVVDRQAERAVNTTALMRWSSKQRRTLFGAIAKTPIEHTGDEPIPKIGSPQMYDAYKQLRRVSGRLSDHVETWCRWQPADGDELPSPAFSFAATSYNWINCLPELSVLPRFSHSARGHYDVALVESQQAAHLLYACASSRWAYFLWRAEGDGFHLTRSFAESIPVPDSPQDRALLIDLGSALWEESRDTPTFSNNRGRLTVGIPPACPRIVGEIDSALADSFGLTPEFDVGDWYLRIVDAGRSQLAAAARR